MAKRTVKPIRVMVYKNLHLDCFSICDYKTRRLLGHTHDVYLVNAEFRVNQSGRQRVLNTGHKNVHAWIIGDLVISPKRMASLICYDKWVEISYSPKFSSKFHIDNGLEVDSAEGVWIHNGRCFADYPK